jgi:hypothetical protein
MKRIGRASTFLLDRQRLDRQRISDLLRRVVGGRAHRRDPSATGQD